MAPDEDLVERLAADLCDRGARPGRSVYHPSSWEKAGRENAGPPEVTKRTWWRRHAREVIAFVVANLDVPPRAVAETVADLRALHGDAVIVDRLGAAYQRDSSCGNLGYWLRAGVGGRTSDVDVMLPARIVDAGGPR